MSNDEKMDLILHNGNVHTMDKENPTAQAVAIRGDKIAAVGSDAYVLAMKGSGTEIIDLGGKTVIPGFNDSHMHLLGFALQLGKVDLSGAKSIQEIISRFKFFIKENSISKDTVVIGRGWNEVFFDDEKRALTKFDLDVVEHPVYAIRACGHVGSANSAMLRLYGIDKNTPDVQGGEIVKDDNGEPTGLFLENAVQVFKDTRELSTAQVENLILSTLPHLAKYGITSIQSDDFLFGAPNETVCEAFTNLAKAGKLTVRVTEKCRALSLDEYGIMLELPQVQDDIAPFFKLGPAKIMSDGSLGGRTAFLKEDYYDDPGNRGLPIFAKDELEAIVELAHNNNRNVAMHAIGDAAIEWCLDAIKKAQDKNPNPYLRHGIVHCQITDLGLIEDFKRNNVIAYIQPIFIHADWKIAKSRVGKAKAATSYAFKTLTEMGVPIPFGTDCPVEPLSPFENIYCAVARKDLNKQPVSGFNPNEALSVYQVVYSYTVDGAYTSGEENEKGKIKEGMYADMAVLSKDIFNTEPEELLGTEVEMTVFNGRIIYRRLKPE